MKVFSQIAVPHSDITQGKLTMDIFAADIWQVLNGKAPADYLDMDLFFNKTYPTKGLKNLLDVVNKRLEGKGGDSVIQLQTPFGGGKTHALIALYHEAKRKGLKVCVFDGSALSPKETRPWEEIEKQLTGQVKLTKGEISPGKEKLSRLLGENQPVLILMDEILEYATKAAGVKVGDSNLAAQTLAFMQEITAAVSSLEKALLVITLPSSLMEHYDENAEKLYGSLQKVTGRTERIYTPVEEEEIEHVIRKRLFQSVNEAGAKEVVNDFVNYATTEGLLSGDEVQRYRERFINSFPFKPEVIDVLYKRWGSFPTFQRTRGVLRLLSLVIYDLLDKKVPFIRLGDFDLGNNEIRIELIKHIGQEWDSIIAQDITSKEAGAKIVDDNVGSAYKAYKLGTVISRTIFMYSFLGSGERGVGLRELKLSSCQPDFQSSIIDSVINELKEKLFYLSDEGLYFTNRPNLNRILLTREENIPNDGIVEEERALLEKSINKRGELAVYIWPDDHKDIPDTPDLKLIILRDGDPDWEFIEKHGESPRIYRNMLIFLAPDTSQRPVFYDYLRRLLAMRSIQNDPHLNLTESQKKEIKEKLKSLEARGYEELRKCYRQVFVPAKNKFKEIDLGIPTFGETFVDREIFNRLRSEGEILERISPGVIREKYLKDTGVVGTKSLLESLWKTPGEMRLTSAEGFKEGIQEGVEKGIFGLGYVEEGKPICKHFKNRTTPEISDNEIILRAELCRPATEPEEVLPTPAMVPVTPGIKESTATKSQAPVYKEIHLKVAVPRNRMSDISKIINFLNGKFTDCQVEVEIKAKAGEITVSDYEDKIKETITQADIEIEKEEHD